MIAKAAPYAILALLLALGVAMAQIYRLEARLADQKAEFAELQTRLAKERAKRLQDQAKAHQEALRSSQAAREALTARNRDLNRQLREVADYADKLSISLRLYINRMLDYANPSGMPADPPRPADSAGIPAPDPA